MIWLKNYTITKGCDGISRVVSLEESVCPCCGACLYSRDSRLRTWMDQSGKRQVLRIRRLVCRKCRRIHNELPRMLVPYRRFSFYAVKGSFECKEYCVAENRTIAGWRSWKRDLEALGILVSRFGNREQHNRTGCKTIRMIGLEDLIVLFLFVLEWWKRSSTPCSSVKIG